ncbi:MAG: TonB-dependent receptor [Myxococcota bacterium]|nr:TonB-dependent receptor [Myxococcota bacterium]
MTGPRRCTRAGARALLALALLATGERSAAQEPTPADPGAPVVDVGEVVSTATRTERDLLELPANVSVVDREEIDASGVATIPDLLRRQPGLFVTSTTTNPAGVQVEARGFNNGGALGSSLLVQIDGRRVNQADTGNTDWAQIPLDRVQSIEIVRGPVSAVYGDNAVGGVINIRTRPREGPPEAVLRGRVGRYATGGGSLTASGTVGPVTGQLFVGGNTTDGYRKRSAFDGTEYNGSLEWTLGDRLRLGAQGGYIEDRREFPGSLTQAEIDALGRRAASPRSERDDARVENGHVQGWVEAVLGESIQLRIQPAYRNQTDVATITSIAFGTTDIHTDKLSAGVDTQLQFDAPIAGRPSRFLAGFDFLHETTDRNITSGFGTSLSDNTRDVYGAYIQEELSLSDGLLLTAGVRVDRAEYTLEIADPGPPVDSATAKPRFTVWSPRAAATWQFLPDTSSYVSYARGFRLPNFDEDAPLLGFPPGAPPTIPGLKPQVSDSVEVGIKHRGERFNAALALYWMGVSNEILFDPITFSNANLDTVRHQGIEASAAFQVLDWLQVYANYTLSDVKILESDNPALDGARMPMVPLNRGTVGFHANFPYALEIDANLNVVGSRILANDFSEALPRLDPYAVLDLLFAWRPKLGEHVEAAFTLALRNATGEEYDGFGAEFGGTAFFNPAARRIWEAGITLTVRP